MVSGTKHILSGFGDARGDKVALPSIAPHFIIMHTGCVFPRHQRLESDERSTQLPKTEGCLILVLVT